MQFITRPGWSQERSPLGWWRGVFVYGGPQTLFVPGTTCISPSLTGCLLVLPMPSGHHIPVGWKAEAVAIPAQATAPQWAGMQLPRGWNCLGALGCGFEPHLEQGWL